jgi:hypothetical protein
MSEEKKKAATMFDFIDGVTHKKKDWSKWSEMDQKAFSPFMMNRFLSMRMELTELINEFQVYSSIVTVTVIPGMLSSKIDIGYQYSALYNLNLKIMNNYLNLLNHH